MTARRRRPLDDEQDAGPDWGTEEAAELFAKVRGLCGVSVTREPLTGEMVQQALADARAILEGLDDGDEEEPIEGLDELGAWDPSNFRRLCGEADARVRAKPVPWAVDGRAAWSTVEALMLGLRERGVSALAEHDVRRRISELSDEQLVEVGDRLQRLERKIAPAWSGSEIETLIKLRETLR